MPTNYPGSLDTLTNPIATDTLVSPSHAGQHATINDAMEAVQVELGLTPSGPSATIKDRLDAMERNVFHVKGAVGGTAAVGDLVADDRAALQAKIDAAELVKGTVVLDPTTGYLLTSGSLVIDAPITLIAYGKASPVRQNSWGVPAIEIRSADVRILGELYCEYTGARTAFDGAALTASVNSATVKTEAAGDPKQAGSALYLRSSDRLYVERLQVKGFIAGVLYGSSPTAVDQHIESILVDTVDFGVWGNPGINTTIGSIKGRTITRTQGVDEHIVYWTEHATRSIGNYIGAVQVSGVATAISHAVLVKSVDDFYIGSLSASGVGALFVTAEAQGVVDFILARDMTAVLATDNHAAVLVQANSDVTVGGCDIESNAAGTDTTNKSRVFDCTGTSRLIVRSPRVKMIHATPGPVFRNNALSWVYDAVIEYVNAPVSGLAAFFPAGTKGTALCLYIFLPTLIGTSQLIRPESSSHAYEAHVDPNLINAGVPTNASIVSGTTTHHTRFTAELEVPQTMTGATPQIRGGNVFKTANGGATTITNFQSGTNGQRFCVIAGDANTTIGDGANIVTKGGANHLLALGEVVWFQYLESKSYEIQIDSGMLGSGEETTMYPSGGTASFAAQVLGVRKGTVASPDVTSGPLVRVERVVNVAEADMDGDGLESMAAIYGITSGVAASTAQPVGVAAMAMNAGTAVGLEGRRPDAAGLYGVGKITGSGIGVGIGAVAYGRRETNTGKAMGIETAAANYTATAGVYSSTAYPTTGAVWITSVGDSDNGCGIAFGLAPGNKRWQVGIGFTGMVDGGNTGAIIDSSIRDDSNSVRSIDIRGSHTYGIDLNAATLTIPIRLKNNSYLYALNAAGATNQAVLGMDGTDVLVLGSGTGVTGIGLRQSITITEAKDIILGTTTGTKLGTATTQKLGFWNATPVIRPTAVADATDAASAITQLNALLARMRTIGLIA